MADTQDLWDRCLDRLRGSGGFLDASPIAPADSPERAAEAVDYLFMTLSSAYLLISRSDPEHPEFKPWVNQLLDYGAPNPDATYYYAAVAGDGVYRVYGRRNTVHWVNLMTGYDFVGFQKTFGKAFPSRDLDDFEVAADGSFEILLSGTRPAGHTGNWMPLQPEANYLVVRQFAYAPDEQDARMGIERLDRPARSAAPDPAATRAKLDRIIDYLDNAARAWPCFPGWLAKHPENTFHVLPQTGAGEVQGQVYFESLYSLGPDQAMIVEFELPRRCNYWNVQASDRMWRTHEHVTRQSSFNGHRPRQDGDGRVRIVVAHDDPGVDNWVDTCGLGQGHLLIRFQNVDATPALDVRVVAAADVPGLLPADTRRVGPEERDAALREWARARQLRRSW